MRILLILMAVILVGCLPDMYYSKGVYQCREHGGFFSYSHLSSGNVEIVCRDGAHLIYDEELLMPPEYRP